TGRAGARRVFALEVRFDRPRRGSVNTAHPEDRANLPLWQRLRSAPFVGDAQSAGSRVGEFLEIPDNAHLRDLAREPNVWNLLLALVCHSPFLWRLATADSGRLRRCLESAPEASLKACLGEAEVAAGPGTSEAALMRVLRLAKQETALLIAL